MMKWMSLAGVLALSMPAQAGSSVRASSELEADGQVMRAAMAFDGELRTAWVEGDDGHGVDSWLELSLDRARPVSSVSIWVGDPVSYTHLRAHET